MSKDYCNKLKRNGVVRVKIPKTFCPNSSGDYTMQYTERYVAEVVNAEDECFVNAVIKAAKEAGINELDLIDKNFVVSAIAEKQNRVNDKNDVLDLAKTIQTFSYTCNQPHTMCNDCKYYQDGILCGYIRLAEHLYNYGYKKNKKEK